MVIPDRRGVVQDDDPTPVPPLENDLHVPDLAFALDSLDPGPSLLRIDVQVAGHVEPAKLFLR
ncbi:MAG: hypothetical protein V3R89_01710, partial [Thermoanaerobaculia bacterium]